MFRRKTENLEQTGSSRMENNDTRTQKSPKK